MPANTFETINHNLRNMTPERTARGFTRSKRAGQIQVAVRVDPDTFNEVRAYALKKKISFGAAIRNLVEWGLIEAKDAA